MANDTASCCEHSLQSQTGLPDCAVYLPFEPVEIESAVTPWLNQGSLAQSQQAEFGPLKKASPTVRPDGLKGHAYDARRMREQRQELAPQWSGSGPVDALSSALQNVGSFTATLWIRTEQHHDQGRLFKTPAFQINYRGDYIEAAFGKPQTWHRGDSGACNFNAQETWRFVAVTYQVLAGSRGIVCFYYGSPTEGVRLDSWHPVDHTRLKRPDERGLLVIGNSEYDGHRPFVGSMDEFRLWLSADGKAGSLSVEQLEAVRRFDIGMNDTGQ